MKLETIIYKNHPIPMFGRVWVFPTVIYTKDIEGDLGISLKELKKLQLVVANAICGESSVLTCEEFDFLLIWKMEVKDSVPYLESIALKEIFWMKLFSNMATYPMSYFGKDRLLAMAKAAVEMKLVDPVSKKAA